MDKTAAHALLESMLKIRRFEEALIKLFEAGAYRGHCHVYIGQEACGSPALNQMIPGEHCLQHTPEPWPLYRQWWPSQSRPG